MANCAVNMQACLPFISVRKSTTHTGIQITNPLVCISYVQKNAYVASPCSLESLLCS